MQFADDTKLEGSGTPMKGVLVFKARLHVKFVTPNLPKETLIKQFIVKLLSVTDVSFIRKLFNTSFSCTSAE